MSVARARRRRTELLAALVACTGAGACWPGWMEIISPTPSREHVVEDLRVLAVDVEPASITVPAELAYADGAPLSLAITPRVFDPRGGAIQMGVSLCAATDRYAKCAGDGLFVGQRTIEADASRPLGPADVTLDLTLTRDALAQLWRDVDAPFPSLVPITVLVHVSVVREVDDMTEREVAVLPLEARVDPSGALVPDADLHAVSLTRCASLDDDIGCGGSQVTAFCGDDVVGPGEACDPPAIDLCSDTCQSIAICPSHLPALCARAATPNARPLLVGLVESTDLYSPVFDVAPDHAPGARIRTQRGARLSLVPVLRTSDQEMRAIGLSGRFDVDPGGSPLPVPERPDVEGGCPLLPSFSCPTSEALSTRTYLGAGAAALVAPADDLGNFIGNYGGQSGVAIEVGDEEADVPLVVVVSDGAGGMSVASFTIAVR